MPPDPPLSTNPATLRDTESASKPLTLQRALALVEELLDQDQDEKALALIELLDGIAAVEVWQQREGLASAAMRHAYTLTPAYSIAAHAFIDQALQRD